MKKGTLLSKSGLAVAEVLVASVISSIAMAAVFSGSIAIQRCFASAEDYAIAKTDQARLIDYLALDLRRALSVTAGTDATTILTVEIPDYYQANGQPRTPTITKYVASYGAPSDTVTVVYRKNGKSIERTEDGGNAQLVAINVEDFQMAIQDLGKVVKTQVTFAPRFQRGISASARAATTVYNTTLLRNTRKDL